MTTIKYFIPEDGDFEEQPNVFLAPKSNKGYPPTLAQVKQAFPVPGRYHFRFKTPLLPGTEREKSAMPVWMDAIDDRAHVPTWKSTIVCKITRIGVEDDDDDEDFQRTPASITSHPPPAPASQQQQQPPPQQQHHQQTHSQHSFDMFENNHATPPAAQPAADLLGGGGGHDNLLDMNNNAGYGQQQQDVFGMHTSPPTSGYGHQQAPHSGSQGPFF